MLAVTGPFYFPPAGPITVASVLVQLLGVGESECVCVCGTELLQVTLRILRKYLMREACSCCDRE